MTYSFTQGTWRDADAACSNLGFQAIEEYDGFPSLDYEVWMAKFRNGRLAAIALVYPGVMLLLEEHEKAAGAGIELARFVHEMEPLRLWYNACGGETAIATALGMILIPYRGLDSSTIYMAPNVSEIEAHRLLRHFALEN